MENLEEYFDFFWSGISHLETIFRSKGTVNVCSDEEPSWFRASCCYGRYFNQFDGEMHMKIKLFRSPHFRIRTSRHTCFLTKDQLQEHINNILPYLPENFIKKLDITEETERDERFYLINLDADGANIYYRVLLTWIRMAYEFPYSVFTLDTFRLRDRFENISPFNLFRLFGVSYYSTAEVNSLWRQDQSMTHFGVIYPKEVIIERLKAEENNETPRLSNVFDDVKLDQRNFKNIITESGVIELGGVKRISALSLRYWFTEECLEQRFEIYNENLKIIKETNPFSIYEQKES